MRAEQGNFQIAFGLVTYGDYLEDDYSMFGQIKASLKTWGLNETTKFTDLSIRPCSEAELGLTQDEESSLFFPLFKPHVSQV